MDSAYCRHPINTNCSCKSSTKSSKGVNLNNSCSTCEIILSIRISCWAKHTSEMFNNVFWKHWCTSHGSIFSVCFIQHRLGFVDNLCPKTHTKGFWQIQKHAKAMHVFHCKANVWSYQGFDLWRCLRTCRLFREVWRSSNLNLNLNIYSSDFEKALLDLSREDESVN